MYYIHWTNSKAPLVLPQRFPDVGTLGVPKNIGKNTVHQWCLLLSAWIFGKSGWICIMHGTCNIKISFPLWTCSVSEACPFYNHLLV